MRASQLGWSGDSTPRNRPDRGPEIALCERIAGGLHPDCNPQAGSLPTGFGGQINGRQDKQGLTGAWLLQVPQI